MIDGNTLLIAHLGYPTGSFRAPMIYNPYFDSEGINAVVVPMAVDRDDYPALLASLRRLGNFLGALVTMPHKVSTVALLDEVTKTVEVAGSCNAIRRRSDGALVGDMFDGAGFVRALRRNGCEPAGKRALVVGSGGVGSAIAASLAEAGVAGLSLYDRDERATGSLAERLREHHGGIEVVTGRLNPAGHDIIVNATPLGMNAGDPLPVDVTRIDPAAFVGEVVMKQEVTPFLHAARERGCRTQTGTDMLFEQIPAYLEFFGLGTTTPEALRKIARIDHGD